MPLMAPGLVSGKVQVTNGFSNGNDTNGHHDYNRTTALKSADFNKLNSGHIKEFTSSYSNKSKEIYNNTINNNNNIINTSSNTTYGSKTIPIERVTKTPPSTLPKPKKDESPARLATSLR